MEHTANERAGSNNWKDKLGDAGALSDYLLPDKSAAWEKLHGRMHAPVQKKRTGWYWLAAACVLGFTGAAFLLLHTKQQVTVVKQEVKMKAAIDSISVLQPASTATAKPNHDERTAVIAATKLPATKSLKKIMIAPIQSETVKANDSMLITAGNTQPINITPTAPLTATNTPEKKKLKVVHVNELGTPLPELRSRVANDDYSVIQFNILNQQFFNTVPVIPVEKTSTSSKHKNIPN